MSILRTAERTARTVKQCCACQGDILPGQRYVKHALTPGDSEFGNDHWWVSYQHAPSEDCEVRW